MLTGGLGTLFWYIVKPGGNYILGCPPFVAGRNSLCHRVLRSEQVHNAAAEGVRG